MAAPLAKDILRWKTSNGYSSTTKILHPVFSPGMESSLWFQGQKWTNLWQFWLFFACILEDLCFFLIRNICHLPHPLFPFDPSSCFLTNLLVNLKAFPPFSQKWGLDGDAHSYRHNRTWNSSEQIPWASEAPHFRSPFQAIMFTSKSISCHRMVLRANKSQSFQTCSHLYPKCSLSLCQNTEGSFYEGFFWSRSMKRHEGVGHNSS